MYNEKGTRVKLKRIENIDEIREQFRIIVQERSRSRYFLLDLFFPK